MKKTVLTTAAALLLLAFGILRNGLLLLFRFLLQGFGGKVAVFDQLAIAVNEPGNDQSGDGTEGQHKHTDPNQIFISGYQGNACDHCADGFQQESRLGDTLDLTAYIFEHKKILLF